MVLLARPLDAHDCLPQDLVSQRCESRMLVIIIAKSLANETDDLLGLEVEPSHRRKTYSPDGFVMELMMSSTEHFCLQP